MNRGQADQRWSSAGLLGGALVLVLLAVIVWLLRPAPESGTTVGAPGSGSCVAPADKAQQDVDTDDSPEYPWPHTSGQPVRVYFEADGLPPRYASLLAEAASIWARSPCVEPVVVDECPAASNCSSVIVRARGSDGDTDGESEGVDWDGIRQSNTITLYTRLLDTSSDNGALATVVHEMGHALGLVHRSDPESVLNAETNDSTNPIPDAVDFANLARLYG
jgi:hypothetical protein